MQERIVNFVHTPLAAIVSLAVLGVLIILFGYVWADSSKRKNLFQQGEKEEKSRLVGRLLDKIGFIKRAEEKLNERLFVLRVNYTARDVTEIRMLVIAAVLVICALMQNYLLVFPLVILGWVIPGSFVEGRIDKRIALFESQFLGGMQTFLTEFATLGNAQQAFVRVAGQVDYPLRHEFEYIARRLNSGVNPRFIMEDFAARTKNKWAALFAQLMIFHFEDGARVHEQILSVTQQMTSDQLIREKNRTELAAVRFTNLVLNALIPLVFVSTYVLRPEDAVIYTTTPTGRLVVAGVALLSLVSLFLGKRLTKI